MSASRRPFLDVRHPAAVLAWLVALVVVTPANAADRKPLWRPQPIIVLETAVVVEYAVGMARYRQSILESRRLEHVAFPIATRWLWMAPEGGSIQRVATNTFRITDRGCLGSFCTTMDCIVGTWPQLFCHDGQEHQISAPDLQTVVLDDRVYKREMTTGSTPPVAPDASSAADQNTAR